MIKLDEYQKKVVDCNTNAVVSAGAGSGKTTVLAARFLRLLKEERANVSEILTLTFTRKAAAEMYQRIYNLLLEEKTNRACIKAVEDFDKASISTLDSFCSKIARDCSYLFGIPPTFGTDEDAVKTLTEDAALNFVLTKSKENNYMQDFIYINGFENVWKNHFTEIGWSYLCIGSPKDFEKMYENQHKIICKELIKNANTCQEAVINIENIDIELKAILEAKQQIKKIENFQQKIKATIKPKIIKEDLQQIKTLLSQIKLSKSCGSSKKHEVIFYKEQVNNFNTASLSILEMIGTLENDDFIHAMFQLTRDFQTELFELKRSAALLGFSDVLSIAIAGLKEDKKLRKYYKNLYKYIMIDEFQDNNQLQKELLYLLAEKSELENDEIPGAKDINSSKLFFVGDEKQSIYRFRGADVSVFKQLSREIETAGGVSLSLNKNYRSEPELIDFFNNLFINVMKDDSKDFQASFQPLESRASKAKNNSVIKFLYKPYDDSLSEDYLGADEAEAHSIADFILTSIGKLKITDSKANTRYADFSDFAILYRSGANQKNYEQVFRAKGIPYNVQSVRSLFQEAPVNDIYNFLQICLYPEDKTASAAFLRSPFVNVSDLSLIQFMLSNKPIFYKGQDNCCITEKDIESYKAAKQLYTKIVPMMDKKNIAEIISYIWFTSGYRYLILHNSSFYSYLEHYDYLIEFAKKHDKKSSSLATFLDSVRDNLGEYKKIDDLKILSYSTNGVKMMPIHQSKGLEFPIVIVANVGNRGRQDTQGSLPAYISQTAGLSFNIVSPEDTSKKRNNYFYTKGKEDNKEKDEAELRRLLYVALTRAENHLVFSGVHGKNNRRTNNAMLNIFLSALGIGPDENPLENSKLNGLIERIEDIKWEESIKIKKNLVNINKVKEAYNKAHILEYKKAINEYNATELNKLKIINNEKNEISLPEINLEVEDIIQKDSREASFGTLCHNLIEKKIKNNLPIEDTKLNIRENFKEFNDKEWEKVFSEACKLSKKFFNSKLWGKYKKAENIESEMPFTSKYLIDEREVYVKGIIDLLIETDSHVHIIDFKSDRAINYGEYKLQMDIYIKATEEIFLKPVKCSLFYLRGGVEVPIL